MWAMDWGPFRKAVKMINAVQWRRNYSLIQIFEFTFWLQIFFLFTAAFNGFSS